MQLIDLNCDLGEGFPDDERIFPMISSANIACGFHAGDHATMRRSASLARHHDVAIGAHPSYLDRAGFGRSPMEVAATQLTEQVVAQVTALREAAEDEGAEVRYLKPHGALYNRIAHDPEQAEAVAAAAASTGLPLLGLAGTEIERAALRHGVPFFSEAFADRAYRADGTLVPRSEPGAVLDDAEAVADRAVRIVQSGSLTAVTGEELTLMVRSLCVHGDSPNAVRLLSAIRGRLPAIRAFA
jgi:UPF0271 protein